MHKDDVARIAAAAEFHVAPYDDCGTARLTVRYDTTPPANPRADCRDQIWLEGAYGSTWIAFDYEIADEVCAAIQLAAKAVRAHLTENRDDQ